LWERVQARLTLNNLPKHSPKPNTGKYLLSGMIRCGVCKGAYIKTNQGYRCANHRNRGEMVCSNGRGIQEKYANDIVLTVVENEFHSLEHIRPLLEKIREEILAQTLQDETPQKAELRRLEREISNIKDDRAADPVDLVDERYPLGQGGSGDSGRDAGRGRGHEVETAQQVSP
jgi:hypothetical protein